MPKSTVRARGSRGGAKSQPVRLQYAGNPTDCSACVHVCAPAGRRAGLAPQGRGDTHLLLSSPTARRVPGRPPWEAGALIVAEGFGDPILSRHPRLDGTWLIQRQGGSAIASPCSDALKASPYHGRLHSPYTAEDISRLETESAIGKPERSLPQRRPSHSCVHKQLPRCYLYIQLVAVNVLSAGHPRRFATCSLPPHLNTSSSRPRPLPPHNKTVVDRTFPSRVPR